MTKVLKKIGGATYSIDAEEGIAYVSGKVDPQKLLRRLVNAGKEAELCWVKTGGDQYTYGNGYYEDPRHTSYKGSDPYYWDIAHNQHGNYSYNPSMAHYYPHHGSYSYPHHNYHY
ncbi:uncharacterized protein LOC107435493 [Ziziphus jujuba]|uniref:Uncharacterized protein LOC107435493 n=1 Tax=Ziziphus jujuba TaxID=326968 RepID=A0A6P4BTF5_ZIZJJ|nr:uncharacterized protein LOC107435493 [Ziziphus jujuba]